MKFEQWIQYMGHRTPDRISEVVWQSDSIGDNSENQAELVVYDPVQRPELGMWFQFSDHQVLAYNTDPDFHWLEQVDFMGGREIGRLHRHKYIEIGYVVRGCARQRFSDREYRFPQGSFWFCDRNCVHSDVMAEPGLFTAYIKLPDQLFDSICLQTDVGEIVQQFIQLMMSGQKKIRQFLCFIPRSGGKTADGLMELICEEIEQRQTGSDYVVTGLIARLLVTLSREYDVLLTNQDKVNTRRITFDQVETYIRSHFNSITIQELVNRFHYNENYYNQLIKEHTGLTYSEYLQKLRLCHAGMLLKGTKIPVDKVMSQVGYSNKGYFYRLFLNEYDMTPAQYRKKYGKASGINGI